MIGDRQRDGSVAATNAVSKPVVPMGSKSGLTCPRIVTTDDGDEMAIAQPWRAKPLFDVVVVRAQVLCAPMATEAEVVARFDTRLRDANEPAMTAIGGFARSIDHVILYHVILCSPAGLLRPQPLLLRAISSMQAACLMA